MDSLRSFRFQEITLSGPHAIVSLNLEHLGGAGGTGGAGAPAVNAVEAEASARGAGAPAGDVAEGGAGGAGGRLEAWALPGKFAYDGLKMIRALKVAIRSNDSVQLDSFIGNPHIVSNFLNCFHIAAQEGLYESLKWCIKNGIGRLGVDKEEYKKLETPLMLACKAGEAGDDKSARVSCVQLLLLAGANPKLENSDGDTALHLAITTESTDIVELFCALPPPIRSYLFSIKNKAGQTPYDLVSLLSTPCKIKNSFNNAATGLSPPVEVPFPLEEYRATIDPMIPTLVFGSNSRSKVPTITLKNKETGVVEIVSMGDFLRGQARRGNIPALIKHQADLNQIDSQGRNVFMYAASVRRPEVLEWLFENYEEATKESLAEALNRPDDYGWTSAHFAAASGALDTQGHSLCMELLIENGVDVNALENGGFTPLHFAAESLYPDIVKALMASGECKFDALSNDGYDALYYAKRSRTPLTEERFIKIESILQKRLEIVKEENSYKLEIAAIDALISTFRSDSRENQAFLGQLLFRRSKLIKERLRLRVV